MPARHKDGVVDRPVGLPDEGKPTVRESFVRGQLQTPKSHKSQRTFEVGTVTLASLDEQWRETAHVQMKAGHSQGAITQRYIHASKKSPAFAGLF